MWRRLHWRTSSFNTNSLFIYTSSDPPSLSHTCSNHMFISQSLLPEPHKSQNSNNFFLESTQKSENSKLKPPYLPSKAYATFIVFRRRGRLILHTHTHTHKYWLTGVEVYMYTQWERLCFVWNDICWKSQYRKSRFRTELTRRY